MCPSCRVLWPRTRFFRTDIPEFEKKKFFDWKLLLFLKTEWRIITQLLLLTTRRVYFTCKIFRNSWIIYVQDRRLSVSWGCVVTFFLLHFSPTFVKGPWLRPCDKWLNNFSKCWSCWEAVISVERENDDGPLALWVRFLFETVSYILPRRCFWSKTGLFLFSRHF